MAEIVLAILLYVTGHESRINLVRMLELAEVFEDLRMPLWCGAAVELADIGCGVAR